MPGYWQSCRIRANTDQGHGQGGLCPPKPYCSLVHVGLRVHGNCQNMTGSRASADWAQIEGREKGSKRLWSWYPRDSSLPLPSLSSLLPSPLSSPLLLPPLSSPLPSSPLFPLLPCLFWFGGWGKIGRQFLCIVLAALELTL